MLVGFGSTYYYVCMLHTWKVGNACTRFRNAPWILWIQGAALPPLRMWRSLCYPRRPSAGPLYFPRPPAPPSLPLPPPLQFQGVGATVVQSVLLEFDKRKAHTSFLFSALHSLCSSSWAVGCSRAQAHWSTSRRKWGSLQRHGQSLPCSQAVAGSQPPPSPIWHSEQ